MVKANLSPVATGKNFDKLTPGLNAEHEVRRRAEHETRVIESTTNCIWVGLGPVKIPLDLDDVDRLIDALKEAKQRGGKWAISTSLGHG
jgi:hypothetical protein